SGTPSAEASVVGRPCKFLLIPRADLSGSARPADAAIVDACRSLLIQLPTVIARSRAGATKQSRPERLALDCVAPLAMTPSAASHIFIDGPPGDDGAHYAPLQPRLVERR